ncbi:MULTISPECIES: MaoC family dehydratase [Amycolatopsis]|uniref:Acyl dehydratase n=1 Tax=Amycolatopsis thermoflava TaxID=84480 RepID=A0A3N2G680_9PSEU|nr:MaoC family dehydratase [Amycolatopsis thermoflava]ROS32057.1 acyl dehydratase [Amycolatopsis thermoflava]
MRTITGVAELRALVGTELGTSAWHEVTQARIDAFAAASDDFEDIHLDPARGAAAGFGGTIAHGLYTLSLGPKFLYEIYTMRGHSLGLNYGFERVRFLSPVPAGSRVRMVAHLTGATEITGGTRFTLTQTFEIEGHAKPACVAESLIAYFD